MSLPPRVGVFCLSFLPYSQTFVYDELVHCTRYRPEVFTPLRRNSDRFPFPAVHAMASESLGGAVRWRERLYRFTGVSPAFHRRLRTGGFRVLHAHFGWAAMYALPHAALLDLPLVVTFYGWDVPLLHSPRRFSPRHWRYWLGSRWLFRRADRILAVSRDLVDRLVALGAPPERTQVKHIGVTIPPPRAGDRAPGPFRVLMVGRFVEKKGFEYGIEAFGRALSRGLDARLRIAGDGPLRPVYERLLGELGLGDRVEFLGVLRHDEVLEAMREADVLLLPSVTARNGDREGNPTVLKEACALGLPVVATRHAGIPEAVEDGVSALLVPERDAAALADRLALLLGDAELRARLGGAARERMIRDFDIRRITAGVEALYDEVVEARARR
jgi:glycosyltransferase involved in cell wall biosynthesis